MDPTDAAKALFIKALKRYNVDKQMSEEDLEAMGPEGYGYILTNNFIYSSWCDEIGVYSGIECEPPFLHFKFAILPSRYQVACLFKCHIYRQLLTTNEHQNVFRQFQGDEGVKFPSKLLPRTISNPCSVTWDKDICACFGPYSEENKRVWPSIMIDMGPEKEEIKDLFARRDWYLSDNTNVNVWIGVKLFRNTGTWWMGVARRDFTPSANQSHVSEKPWPPPIWVYQLPNEETGGYVPFSAPRDEKWNIPTEWIFHPNPVPNLEFPESFVVHVEEYRNVLENPRQQGGLYTGVLGKYAKTAFGRQGSDSHGADKEIEHSDDDMMSQDEESVDGFEEDEDMTGRC